MKNKHGVTLDRSALAAARGGDIYGNAMYVVFPFLLGVMVAPFFPPAPLIGAAAGAAALALRLKQRGFFPATRRMIELAKKEEAEFPSSEAKPLNADEQALVRAVFGKSIKTQKITKAFSAVADRVAKPSGKTETTYAAVFRARRNHIKFYGDVPAQDFTQDRLDEDANTFLHEATHVWQNQHRVRRFFTRFHDKGYDYEITPRSKFRHFGIEQQASIIGDYAELVLGSTNARMIFPDKAFPEIDGLIPVVEKQFPQARATRLKMEEKALADPRVQELAAWLRPLV